MKSSSLGQNGLTSDPSPLPTSCLPGYIFSELEVVTRKAQSFPGMTVADFLYTTGRMWVCEVWERVRMAALWLVSTNHESLSGTRCIIFKIKMNSFNKEEGMYVRYVTLCLSHLFSLN